MVTSYSQHGPQQPGEDGGCRAAGTTAYVHYPDSDANNVTPPALKWDDLAFSMTSPQGFGPSGGG
jgi:hypothetical protein